MEELERRLTGRGTETAQVIADRLARAGEEAEGMGQYDYILAVSYTHLDVYKRQGVRIQGLEGINPVNGKKIPIDVYKRQQHNYK